MIRHTFSILSGVGENIERKLWREGILTWEDFLGSSGLDFVSSMRKSHYDEALLTASTRLREGDSSYFRDRLRRREHWRLFDCFRESAVCLDIETNGYPPERGGCPTVVGLYDGRSYRTLVRGEGLTAGGLMEALSEYKYLITFFGSAFDVPFLERSLLGFALNLPHFDLCFAARRLGMRGGLKRIEASLGIERAEATRGMDGYDAVLLWEQWASGNREALELLVMYNREDTVNLMGIADTVYRGLKSSTGIEELCHAAP